MAPYNDEQKSSEGFVGCIHVMCLFCGVHENRVPEDFSFYRVILVAQTKDVALAVAVESQHVLVAR